MSLHRVSVSDEERIRETLEAFVQGHLESKVDLLVECFDTRAGTFLMYLPPELSAPLWGAEQLRGYFQAVVARMSIHSGRLSNVVVKLAGDSAHVFNDLDWRYRDTQGPDPARELQLSCRQTYTLRRYAGRWLIHQLHESVQWAPPGP
jgi:ketosteroid isomerase-like protein